MKTNGFLALFRKRPSLFAEIAMGQNRGSTPCTPTPIKLACICFKSVRLWSSSSRTRFCSARAPRRIISASPFQCRDASRRSTTWAFCSNTPAPKIPCEQGYIQGNFPFPLGVTSLSGGRIKEIDPQRGELEQGASRELSGGLFPEVHFPGVSTAVVPSGEHSPALLSLTDDEVG